MLDEDEQATGIPPDVLEFNLHYMALCRTAFELLHIPAFHTLATRGEEIERVYDPGGPPISPLYDSMSAIMLLTSMPVGMAKETPMSVVARLLVGSAAFAKQAALARQLAETSLVLYRAEAVNGHDADLVHVAKKAPRKVRLSGTFLREGDLFLGRIYEFEGQSFIMDSPYLLLAPESEWLEYFERIRTRAPSAAGSHPGAKRGGTDKKRRQGKNRKDKKKRAAKSTTKRSPEELLRDHLKYGDNWRFWFDFIMDGYAGQRNGIVRLAGVPDRPESLPHNAAYDGPPLPDDGPSFLEDDPLRRLRDELLRIVAEEEVFDELLESLELGHGEFPDHLAPLAYAYCQLGAPVDDDGLTALELYTLHGNPPEDERAVIRALSRGWFSLFEVRHVFLDEKLVVMDTLRRKKLEITERLATRGLVVGDLLAGWIMIDDDSVVTLEGGLVRVPAMLAEPVIAFAKRARDDLRSRFPKVDGSVRLGLLPPSILAALLDLYAAPPMPELRNTDDQALSFRSAHYRFDDRAAVHAALSRAFEDLGDGEFQRLNDAGFVVGRLELRKNRLVVHANSAERLDALGAELEELLGEHVTHAVNAIDGPPNFEAQDERNGPIELPPEMQREIATMMLQRLRKTLDEPLPMHSGKTLRQLSRTKTGRADATNWLREQERLLRSNPQLELLDMRPLWEELGLEYRGLQ